MPLAWLVGGRADVARVRGVRHEVQAPREEHLVAGLVSPVDQAQVAQSPVAPAPVADFAPLTPVVEKHYDLEQQKKKLDKIKKEIPIRRDRPEVEHYF